MKRYAIVRVDNKCPSWCGDNPKLDYIVCDLKAKSCTDKCKYGDTKEQLVRKVAQALFRRKLDLYNLIWGGVPSKAEAKKYYETCLETAKEIVEFLGVE